MKPAAFDYARPQRRAEVLKLLADTGSDARVLAGGQSLMAVLNMRLAEPSLIIDIGNVADLRYIEIRDDRLCIGANTRQAELIDWPELADRVPLLARAMPWVGHFQTRNRGTVCGSVAHADPSAELPLCLAVLGGEIVLERRHWRRGRRVVPAAEFFQGLLTTAREPDELLTEVRFPLARADHHYRFTEVAMRHGDFALVALAADIGPDEILLGAGGVADRPVVRRIPGDADLNTELNTFAWSLGAEDDGHASAAYRRQLVRELGYKLLTEAQP
jgi:2-furoyl-CoA dehydrogenase FAD binding subunit